MVRISRIGVKNRLSPRNKFKKCAEICLHFLQRFSAIQRKICKIFAHKNLKNQRIPAHFSAFQRIQLISSIIFAHSAHFLQNNSNQKAVIFVIHDDWFQLCCLWSLVPGAGLGQKLIRFKYSPVFVSVCFLNNQHH